MQPPSKPTIPERKELGTSLDSVLLLDSSEDTTFAVRECGSFTFTVNP